MCVSTIKCGGGTDVNRRYGNVASFMANPQRIAFEIKETRMLPCYADKVSFLGLVAFLMACLRMRRERERKRKREFFPFFVRKELVLKGITEFPRLPQSFLNLFTQFWSVILCCWLEGFSPRYFMYYTCEMHSTNFGNFQGTTE